MPEFAHASGSKYKASSEYHVDQAVTKAFDSNTGTYWMGTGAGVDWLRVDARPWLSKWTPTSYAIRVNSVPQPTRAPKNFALDGSNDCASWTTLDARTNETAWASGEERTFTVTGAAAYRFFRLNITANNGDATYTQVAELSMYGTASAAATLISPPGNMLEYNDPAPYIATESGWWTNAGINYKFFRAMNAAVAGDKTWIIESASPWAQLYLGATAYRCGRYEICPQNHATLAPVRSPKNFTLKGSNDGSSWTTVHTVVNSTGWVADTPKFFTPDVTDTAYRYFRLDISANNGDSYTTITEFYLYAPAAATGRSTVSLID